MLVIPDQTVGPWDELLLSGNSRRPRGSAKCKLHLLPYNCHEIARNHIIARKYDNRSDAIY